MTGRSVRIGKRVWTALRKLEEQFDDNWTLELLLRPDGNVREAERALREAVREVQDAYARRVQSSAVLDPPDAGEWDCAVIADGLHVVVRDSNVFEEALPLVAEALLRRGVTGSLEPWKRPAGAEPPRQAPCLACRARVAGDRVHRGERSYLWQADLDALTIIIAAAERWCRTLSGEASASSLSIGTTGWLAIGADEEVVAQLLQAARDDRRAELLTTSDDLFRCVTLGPAGGVTLVSGGDVIDTERGRRRELDALTDLLRDHADALVYGRVLRGWDIARARSTVRDTADWPTREGAYPRGAGWTWLSFGDLYANDAFGLQLLGEGFADRVAEIPTSSWQLEPVGERATLVTHTDLGAWFDAPFVTPNPPGVLPEGPTGPSELLARARIELASVLYVPGALKRLGYTDLTD